MWPRWNQLEWNSLEQRALMWISLLFACHLWWWNERALERSRCTFEMVCEDHVGLNCVLLFVMVLWGPFNLPTGPSGPVMMHSITHCILQVWQRKLYKNAVHSPLLSRMLLDLGLHSSLCELSNVKKKLNSPGICLQSPCCFPCANNCWA